MPDVVTDTHALIWYLEDSPKLSVAANRLFTGALKSSCLLNGLVFKERKGDRDRPCFAGHAVAAKQIVHSFGKIAS